jgi:hypothetical protein
LQPNDWKNVAPNVGTKVLQLNLAAIYSPRDALIIQRYQHKEADQTIAQDLHISRQRVYQVLNRWINQPGSSGFRKSALMNAFRAIPLTVREHRAPDDQAFAWDITAQQSIRQYARVTGLSYIFERQRLLRLLATSPGGVVGPSPGTQKV